MFILDVSPIYPTWSLLIRLCGILIRASGLPVWVILMPSGFQEEFVGELKIDYLRKC